MPGPTRPDTAFVAVPAVSGAQAAAPPQALEIFMQQLSSVTASGSANSSTANCAPIPEVIQCRQRLTFMQSGGDPVPLTASRCSRRCTSSAPVRMAECGECDGLECGATARPPGFSTVRHADADERCSQHVVANGVLGFRVQSLRGYAIGFRVYGVCRVDVLRLPGAAGPERGGRP